MHALGIVMWDSLSSVVMHGGGSIKQANQDGFRHNPPDCPFQPLVRRLGGLEGSRTKQGTMAKFAESFHGGLSEEHKIVPMKK